MLVWEMSGLIPTNKVEWWLGVYMRETENKNDSGLGDLCLGDWYDGCATRGDWENKTDQSFAYFFMLG